MQPEDCTTVQEAVNVITTMFRREYSCSVFLNRFSSLNIMQLCWGAWVRNRFRLRDFLPEENGYKICKSADPENLYSTDPELVSDLILELVYDKLHDVKVKEFLWKSISL